MAQDKTEVVKLAHISRLEMEKRISDAVCAHSETWTPLNVGVCLEHLEVNHGTNALVDVDAFITWCRVNLSEDEAAVMIMQNVPHDLNSCDEKCMCPRTSGYAERMRLFAIFLNFFYYGGALENNYKS